LRRNATRLGQGLALVMVAALLASVGAGLLLWALYLTLAAAFGPALTALITGVVGLIGAGVMLWIAQVNYR